MFQRNCPSCQDVIEYKSITSCNRAENTQTWCRKCRTALRWKENEAYKNMMSQRMKGENNPFFGKHHSDETLQILSQKDKSYTKTPEFSQTMREALRGVDTSCDLKAKWTREFGEEESKRREQRRRDKISNSLKGEKNPMFGRPSPMGSGVGFKGWYRGWFFRSLRELSFVLQLESENRTWKSAECNELRIRYVHPLGQIRTYCADFLIDGNILVECKPVRLQNSPVVLAKQKAAEEFCMRQNWVYLLVDPKLISYEKLDELVSNGNVLLTQKTKEKVDATRHYDTWASSERQEHLG